MTQVTSQSWLQPDWPKQAQQWVNRSLRELDYQVIGSLVLIKGWSLGYVYKQKTNKGDVFFKATASLPLFSNESQLCATLYDLFPNAIATTLAYEPQQQWLLTADFGTAFVDTVPLSDWALPFNAFAKLQQRSILHLDKLIDSGCIQRDIRNLPDQLTAMFADDNITARLPKDIPQSAAQISEVMTKLTQQINALLQLGLPNTLVHSDLHIENIAPNTALATEQASEPFIYFDWSDACISHPFIDGTYVFRIEKTPAKQQIVQAYLSQWQSYADMEALHEAWHLAEGICYAHQAVSYGAMNHILDHDMDLLHAFENAFRRFMVNLLNK
ncbi:phosphotransferase [Shewanella sp. MMG014]|uniref:phosphotransferase n=1 Tax=Shewanella sp. MMG014 TaxID=2822691 RepID=UPI001B3902F6|nr:phosphotransferase [Shewanella sp. MMG014]MBQ4890803.1 phosphotransferase [Shewanella sp. MMG014]